MNQANYELEETPQDDVDNIECEQYRINIIDLVERYKSKQQTKAQVKDKLSKSKQNLMRSG